MGSVVLENDKFYYSGNGKKELLLDCKDYINNNSRLPLEIDNGNISVVNLLLALLKSHSNIIAGVRADDSMEMLLLDILFAKRLMKSKDSIKVLEIGCTDGIVSYHLATMIGCFNPNSTLCCVSNTMGNDSGNNWLDYIASVSQLPKLSFMSTDYDDIMLQSDYFDVVMINGTCFFEEPIDVISQAKRLVKDSGNIICYANSQPLLDSTFKLMFSNRKEYNINHKNNIYII